MKDTHSKVHTVVTKIEQRVEYKRIMVKVPCSLLRELDGAVDGGRGSRSEFVQSALRRQLEEMRCQKLREQMRLGYQEMARINLCLAEEGIPCDLEAMSLFAVLAAERD